MYDEIVCEYATFARETEQKEGTLRPPYLIDCAIVCADDKSMLVHVQNKILAHDGQSNQGDIGFSTRQGKIL